MTSRNSIRAHSLALRHQPVLRDALRSERVDDFVLEGRTLRRLTVLIPSGGCSTPTCTMCPLPNLAYRASHDDLAQFVAEALERAGDVEMLSIYNDGSYFSPREIPVDTRRSLESLVRESDVEWFNVESLPSLIDEGLLTETSTNTNAKLLLNIGVQSGDSVIRDRCVGSPFRDVDLDRAFEAAEASGARLRTYLLFKPPFLNEFEAMEDLRGSLDRVAHPSVAIVSVNPCKVAAGTVLQEIYAAGLYRPPHLFSISRVLATGGAGRNVQVEWPTKGTCPGDVDIPHVCKICFDSLDALGSNRERPIVVPNCWHEYLNKEPRESWIERLRVFEKLTS